MLRLWMGRRRYRDRGHSMNAAGRGIQVQQFRPEATRRLARFARRTDRRGMEIVPKFGSEIIADEPSLLEDSADVDFL